MAKGEIDGSTIGMILVIVVTIFPLTQVVLLTLNGSVTYDFAILFGVSTSHVEIVIIAVNGIVMLLAMGVLFFSKKAWTKIVATFFVMFCGQMLMTFVSDGFNGGDNDDYLLAWITVAGVPILIILLVSSLNFYSKRRFL